MKIVIFLSLFVASNAWLLLHKYSKHGKANKLSTLLPPSPTSQKVVFVDKTTDSYFPLSVITDTDGKSVHSPYAPDTASSASVANGQQQQDYSMLYQPPPIMYGPSDVAVDYSAPVPVDPQYLYGAAGPYAQQFFAVPPVAAESWAMQYGTGDSIPAGPYSPTEAYSETEASTTTQA